MNKTKKAKDKLIRERTKLLLSRPFFGSLALGLEFTEDPDVETMSVDGTHLFFNPDFVLQRNEKQIRALVAHEVLHCALGHLWRQGARELERWNYATDFAVNWILAQEGFEIPPDCCFDPQYAGLNAEQIYAKIGNEKRRLTNRHDRWPGKKTKEKDENSRTVKENKDGSESSGEKKDDPAKNNPPERNIDVKGEIGKKKEKEWRERLVHASATSRMRGKIPGTAEQMIRDALEPRLDWRAILRDMVVSFSKNNFRLMPPAKKHLWRGIYLPSVSGESLEIALAVDTSASISEETFKEFIGEVKNIAEQFEDVSVNFFLCDAKIHYRTVLFTGDEWPEGFLKQNGGTSFVPVFQAIEDGENIPTVLVYLTDGDGEYPSCPPEYPVIWILNKEREVPFGASVLISGGDV